jgi:hypothetical protein
VVRRVLARAKIETESMAEAVDLAMDLLVSATRQYRCMEYRKRRISGWSCNPATEDHSDWRSGSGLELDCERGGERKRVEGWVGIEVTSGLK